VSLTAQGDAPVSETRRPLVLRRHAATAAARTGLVARLTAAGLDETLAIETVGRLDDSQCRPGQTNALTGALAASLAEASAPAADARVEVFVGPPGVGKTTTIAKLTAQEKQRGRSPRAVLAADVSRVGAVEHLQGYARIIGSPFRVVRDARELDHAIKASRRPLIVDTAGRLPSDAAVAPLLDVLRSRDDVVTHLVIEADTTPASAARLLDRYAGAAASRIVISKLDEAESAAPLIGFLRERGMPISYLTTGPRVPDDLVRATPSALAAAMLGELPEGDPTWH
jgi:flagellar biosynthesis protein FlhF